MKTDIIKQMDIDKQCTWEQNEETINYLGAQLWERYLFLKHSKKLLLENTNIMFTSFSGCLDFDAFTSDSNNELQSIIEIKVRKETSTTYTYPMIEIKRYSDILRIQNKLNIPKVYYVSIWGDGVATWNDLEYSTPLPSNVKRSASDTYNTTKIKDYGCYLLNEHNPINTSIDVISDIDRDEWVKKQLRARGFKPNNNFTLTKKI